MTEPLTFTIEPPREGEYLKRVRYPNGGFDRISVTMERLLLALQARAAGPEGDYAALRADLMALRDEWRYSTRDEPYAEALTAILIAHPPLDLPDGFALTPTADAAAALAAVRTGKWTAHYANGKAAETDLAYYAEYRPHMHFIMRPVSPPMVRVGDGDLPADASDDEIVAAFRAQGGAGVSDHHRQDLWPLAHSSLGGFYDGRLGRVWPGHLARTIDKALAFKQGGA